MHAASPVHTKQDERLISIDLRPLVLHLIAGLEAAGLEVCTRASFVFLLFIRAAHHVFTLILTARGPRLCVVSESR